MKTTIAIDISPPVTYLAKFWFSSYGPKWCWSIELQNSLKCNISRKKWMMKFIFAMSRNIEVFYKLILPSGVRVPRHAHSTQNKNFAYLCNISRKTWGIKWFFCLQINTKVFYKMILSFWVDAARVTQSSQNNKFAISSQYLKENGKIIFCLQINIKDFFKLILSF